MKELTKLQRQLMEHTISGPDRNWFATSKECSDYKVFENLVQFGYATKEPAPDWSIDDVVFRLTKLGRRILNHK